ncbi:MAG: hypothetical protein IH786_10900, partial [Proteobacteria bacterium]|nr:hypothetical protein [Pseudomonadota bacterium]
MQLIVVGAGSCVDSDNVRLWGGSTALVTDGGSVICEDNAVVGLGGTGLATATISGPGSSWAVTD